MKLPVLIMSLCLALPAAASTTAASQLPAADARQDTESMRATVQRFLETQAAGLPGRVEVKVGAIDSRLNAPACAALEAFLPGGARPWGRTTVGVRCNAPTPWTRYVTAQVSVWGDYLVAATAIAQNQQIGQADISRVSGDLTTLPAGIVTDPQAAIGRTAAVSLASGAPLRRESLRAQPAIQQGQLVRLVTNGPGFRASTEARAITNAAEGQVAQARTASGAVIAGIARPGGIVEVAF